MSLPEYASNLACPFTVPVVLVSASLGAPRSSESSVNLKCRMFSSSFRLSNSSAKVFRLTSPILAKERMAFRLLEVAALSITSSGPWYDVLRSISRSLSSPTNHSKASATTSTLDRALAVARHVIWCRPTTRPGCEGSRGCRRPAYDAFFL